MDERLAYAVLSAVEDIPPGRVASYGQVARMVGRAHRRRATTAMILTMNVPAEALDQWQYPTLLGINAKLMEGIFGYSEELYACNTYQFSDYSRYDINLFKEEEKRAYRDAHFATDLANARALGKRLIQKAMQG